MLVNLNNGSSVHGLLVVNIHMRQMDTLLMHDFAPGNVDKKPISTRNLIRKCYFMLLVPSATVWIAVQNFQT